MLKGHKVLHEAKDHFVVKHPDGHAFKVAKQGLAHTTVEKIRGYAEGGEVQPADSGAPAGLSPDEQKAYLASLAATGAQVPQTEPTPNIGPQPGEVDPTTGLPMASADPGVPAAAPGSQVLPPSASAAPALPPTSSAFTPPPPQDTQMNMPRGSTPYSPATPPADLAKGAAEQRQGVQDMAKAKGAEANSAAQIQQEANQRQAAAAGAFEADQKVRADRAEQLFQSVAKGNIDPNHFWATRSTGQKIGSAIGLILGGIGAGLTRGPNLAAQTIDAAIDRDMEAQRADIGKRASLLSHYVAETKDLRTAYSFAKADALDATAGALTANALKYGDPKAHAEAELAVGQLRTQAAQLRQQATLTAFQIQGAAASGAWQKQFAGALQQGMANDGASGGAPGVPSPARVALMSSFMGKPEQWAAHQIRIPEERQIGTDKSGAPKYQTVVKSDLAATPEDAKKANEGLLANREQSEKLRRIELFVKQHPAGAWSPAEKQRVASLAQDFKLSWNKGQEGLNRVNEVELDMVDKMMADPAGFWSNMSGKTDSALNVMRSAVNSRKVGIVDAYRAH